MARRGALAAALFGVLGMNTTRERYLSDVALADLGKTWTQVDPLPTGRSAFGVAVIDAELYVLGGYDGSSYLNDVLSTVDSGSTWTTVASTSTWSARQNFAVAVLGTKVFLGCK